MEEEPHLPWYVFERRKALRDVLLADIEIPLPFGGPKAALASSPWNHLFLSLGGSRAGALFHAHAPAWNALIFGKKRWLLFDERLIAERHAPLIRAFREMAKPSSINHSNADFLTTVYRTPEFQKWWGSHGYECIQEAGEMLYIHRSVLSRNSQLGRGRCGDRRILCGRPRLYTDELCRERDLSRKRALRHVPSNLSAALWLRGRQHAATQPSV